MAKRSLAIKSDITLSLFFMSKVLDMTYWKLCSLKETSGHFPKRVRKLQPQRQCQYQQARPKNRLPMFAPVIVARLQAYIPALKTAAFVSFRGCLP